jgi:hypothetical protein
MPYSSPYGTRVADLLLRQGEIAAQRAQAPGMVWGNVAQNVGQNIGNLLTQRRERIEEAPRRAYDEALMQRQYEGWDRQDVTRAIIARNTDPDTGQLDNKQITSELFQAGIPEAASPYQAKAQEQDERTMVSAIMGAHTVNGVPNYKGAAQTIANTFGGNVPASAQWIIERGTPDIRPYEPGVGLYDVSTDIPKLVTETPSLPKELSFASAQKVLLNGEPNFAQRGSDGLWYGMDRQKLPIGSVAPWTEESGSPTPTSQLNATRALRNDFIRETSSASTAMVQYDQMKSALEAVRSGSLAAGSQGVLVTFQKILDPISVVRESEYARSASGLSLMSRLEGQWQTITAGGAGVPISELEKYVALAEQFARNQADYARETKRQIDGMAKRFGLNADFITREFNVDGLDTEPFTPTPTPGPSPVGDFRYDENGNLISTGGNR